MRHSSGEMSSLVRQAVPVTLPVMAGYIFLGIAYGITMKEAGFGALWSGLASLFVYGGSMQFALAALLKGAFSPLTIALMTLLIQARHIFYGLSMLEPYGKVEKARPYLIFALTDETYSLVVRPVPQGLTPWKWYLAVSALDQSYWFIGSLLGALLGTLLNGFDLTGIDFAMTALFTVIVTEQCTEAYHAWHEGKMSGFDALFPGLLGLISTLCCLLLMGTSSFLIGAMVTMLICFFLRYRTVKGGRKA